MAKPKKATKTRKRAEKALKHPAESVGPERRRVRQAETPAIVQFILEEARDVREKKHPRLSKEEIVAIGRARARALPVGAPPRGPKGKARTRETSANAYRKSGARRAP